MHETMLLVFVISMSYVNQNICFSKISLFSYLSLVLSLFCPLCTEWFGVQSHQYSSVDPNNCSSTLIVHGQPQSFLSTLSISQIPPISLWKWTASSLPAVPTTPKPQRLPEASSKSQEDSIRLSAQSFRCLLLIVENTVDGIEIYTLSSFRCYRDVCFWGVGAQAAC